MKARNLEGKEKMQKRNKSGKVEKNWPDLLVQLYRMPRQNIAFFYICEIINPINKSDQKTI